MTKKNLVQVVIGGKVLTMGGSEDELHIQKVASCVNRKLQELEPMESYRALPVDLKPILVELNLAEELIQARETIEMLKADLQMRENELSEVKQLLVETQIQLEEIESSAVQMTFADVGWMPEQMSGGQNSQAQTNADGNQTSRTLQDADEGKGSRTSQNSDEGKESRTLQKVAGKQETRILQEADGNQTSVEAGDESENHITEYAQQSQVQEYSDNSGATFENGQSVTKNAADVSGAENSGAQVNENAGAVYGSARKSERKSTSSRHKKSGKR